MSLSARGLARFYYTFFNYRLFLVVLLHFKRTIPPDQGDLMRVWAIVSARALLLSWQPDNSS